jgi:glycine hydroxymethyltransferase
MAQGFIDRGYDVISNGTDDHLFLLSLIKQGITGKDADAALGRANITVNKNAVPNDPKPPFVTSGLRIGSPAITTRGLKETQTAELTIWMCDILDDLDNDARIMEVQKKVIDLCSSYPVYQQL